MVLLPYLVGIAGSPWWSSTNLLLAGALAAVASAGLARDRRRRPLALLLAWAPLHLVLLATGGLASPFLPLVVGWLLAVGWRRVRLLAPAVAVAALLLPLSAWGRYGAPAPPELLVLVLLLAVAVPGAISLGKGRRRGRAGTAVEGIAGELPDYQRPPGPSDRGATVANALELVRMATGAEQVVLWRGGEGRRVAVRSGWAGRPADPPPERIALRGHPFGWALEEQLHLRLQPGRRELPASWAEGMLVVPVDLPDGLLALAFREDPCPEAEEGAHRGANLVQDLMALLVVDRSADLLGSRVRSVVETLNSLPHRMDLDGFGEGLCARVRESLGATGVAFALWHWEWEEGRIRSWSGAGAGPPIGERIGEGRSRVALAARQGTALQVDDLATERPRLPLCAQGERLDPPPRSAVVVPLRLRGNTIGVLAAWHAEPHRFGGADLEFLQLLATLAAPPFGSIVRHETLGARASRDPLTGLANRQTFEQRLGGVRGEYGRYGRPYGVAMLDIDHFKGVNDTHGHEAGDAVLRQVARVLIATVREVDLVARLGGEEFVVLLPESDLEACREAAGRIRRAVEATRTSWMGRTLGVTVSLGVAACPGSGVEPPGLLAAADAALYLSKAEGRNRVTVSKVLEDNKLPDSERVDGGG